MSKNQLPKRTGSGTQYKKVLWHPKALEAVSAFPEDVKRQIGFLLFKMQKGEMLEMPSARVMPSVEVGVYELRVRGKDGTYRMFYFLKSVDRILAFHAFQKKTEKTDLSDIKLGKKRLKELMEH